MKTVYTSSYEDKEQFVKDILEPMLLSFDMGFVDAKYKRVGSNEFVSLTNRNSDKTILVNVSCDSIRALVQDVMRALKFD